MREMRGTPSGPMRLSSANAPRSSRAWCSSPYPTPLCSSWLSRARFPRALAALTLLYPIHLRWSLRALAEGLTRESIRRLQARYRVLYGVIGLAMVAALWLS